MVGLGRAVISRRERIVMLEPFDKGLMATTLRYVYEVRDTAEYFEDIPSIKVPGEMVELAEYILDTKAGHFDASEFEDRYETAVVEMLRRKQAGLPPEQQPEAAPPTNVVNLMDALRRSIDSERPPLPEAKRRNARSRRRRRSGGAVRGRGRQAEGRGWLVVSWLYQMRSSTNDSPNALGQSVSKLFRRRPKQSVEVLDVEMQLPNVIPSTRGNHNEAET